RVGLVAILRQPWPRDLLLSAPRDAHGSLLRVTRDVDVVAAPRTHLRVWSRRDGPGLPRLNLVLRGPGQLESEAHADVRKDRLLHLFLALVIALGVCLDLVRFLSDLPTFLPPLVERVEDDEAGVDAAGLLEVFGQHVLVGDHQDRALLDVLEAQG